MLLNQSLLVVLAMMIALILLHAEIEHVLIHVLKINHVHQMQIVKSLDMNQCVHVLMVILDLLKLNANCVSFDAKYLSG